MSPPALFDRALLRARRARAGGVPGGALDAAMEHLAAEAMDRLAPVLRPFRDALDLGSPGPQLARALARREGVARVVRAAPPEALGGAGQGSDGDGAEGCRVEEVAADPGLPPFAPGSFDLVVSALALGFVDDLPGALAQARRLLRPDGLLLAVVPAAGTLNELREALAFAEVGATGGLSPRVAPFADLRDLGGLLQRADLALPVADAEALTIRHASLPALARDLRGLGLANPLVERSRRPTPRAVLALAGARLAERAADADGRLRTTVTLAWLSGWAPDPSQQQPLKPGSAKARLADALGVPERGAGEPAQPATDAPRRSPRP